MIPMLLKLAGMGVIGKIVLDLLNDEGSAMYNCHNDVLAYHDEEVTLPEAERREMRKRRDANRERLKDGLARDGNPQPAKSKSQGSYAHRTMVQDPNKDYDIDDGVYFTKEDLMGPQGGDKTASQAKAMVCDGLQDEQFKDAPEVRTNCVRVYYAAGYHVDVPVYRVVEATDWLGNTEVRYEIASSDWKESNPGAVTDWFNENNESQSLDDSNGLQLRRITRFIKGFARSRESWRKRIASGFTITALVVECYKANANREDRALYDTLVAIRDRLNWDLQVKHPVVDGEMLTTGPDDARTKFLRERLDWAIGHLAALSLADCNRETALKAWDKVFDTEFFASQLETETSSSASKVGTSTAVTVPALKPRQRNGAVNPRGRRNA